MIRSHQSAFDAILLDVDNGPEGLIRKANDALYDLKGLQAIRRALRPRGVLAVWSSGPHASVLQTAFRCRLRCQRGRRPRHDKTQRRAARHLVCDQARRRGLEQDEFSSIHKCNGNELPLPLRERVGVRGRRPSIVRYPSPGSHLAMRSDLSRKGRGEVSSRCFADQLNLMMLQAACCDDQKPHSLGHDGLRIVT